MCTWKGRREGKVEEGEEGEGPRRRLWRPQAILAPSHGAPGLSGFHSWAPSAGDSRPPGATAPSRCQSWGAQFWRPWGGCPMKGRKGKKGREGMEGMEERKRGAGKDGMEGMESRGGWDRRGVREARWMPVLIRRAILVPESVRAPVAERPVLLPLGPLGPVLGDRGTKGHEWAAGEGGEKELGASTGA